MTKVLWLTPDKPENISVGRMCIADQLRQRGFDVTISGTTIDVVTNFFRTRSQFDVVIGTTRAGAIAGCVLSLNGGPPLIVDHIDPIRQFGLNNGRLFTDGVQLAENFAFHRSATTLYVYEEEASRVEKYAPSSIKTDLGVNFERFANPSDEAISRASQKLGLDTDENVAIYIGGLEPIYNIPALLDAVALLDDWTLVIIGVGSLSTFVTEASKRRVDVRYLGTVPHEDIPGFLHIADVGVSLVDDAHTLKVLEYGAARLPTVQVAGFASERFEGMVELCELHPDEIAAALQRALQRDPDPLFDYVQQFDYEAIAADYEAAIKTAIN